MISILQMGKLCEHCPNTLFIVINCDHNYLVKRLCSVLTEERRFDAETKYYKSRILDFELKRKQIP